MLVGLWYGLHGGFSLLGGFGLERYLAREAGHEPPTRAHMARELLAGSALFACGLALGLKAKELNSDWSPDRTIAPDHAFAILCIACQAQRSIDRAIQLPWHELQAYYSGPHLAWVTALASLLRSQINAASMDLERLRAILISRLRYTRALHLFSRLAATIRPKRRIRLTPPEWDFVYLSLTRLETLLAQPTRPPVPYIVEHRYDLYLVELLIRTRMSFRARLSDARRVEYYGEPDFSRGIPITELVDVATVQAIGPY